MYDCNLINAGFELPCLTTSGLTDIMISSYASNAVWTSSGTYSIIDGVTASNTFYRIQHDIEQAFFSAPIARTRANGTIVYETNLTIKMNILSEEVRDLFYRLTRSFVTIIAETTPGRYVVAGSDLPGTATEGALESGTLMDDISGATIVFNFRGPEPIKFADWVQLEPDLTIS